MDFFWCVCECVIHISTQHTLHAHISSPIYEMVVFFKHTLEVVIRFTLMDISYADARATAIVT